MIKYHNSITDSAGYIHSIDMIYVEYYSLIHFEQFISFLRDLHLKYKELKYDEYLDRPPSSRYDFYLNNIVFGPAHLDYGKYAKYDHVNKVMDVFDLYQLRINPNKYFDEPWFQELLKFLLDNGVSGMLRKYDYAVDVPLSPEHVQLYDTRKEFGLYKGTRYFGQAGRHGYIKIYDKQKEYKKLGDDIPPTTRIEYTFYNKEKRSLDNILVFDSMSSDLSFDGLKQTEIAIVEMYQLLQANNIPYDLKLGRVMKNKLAPYLLGKYRLIPYDDIPDRLLSAVSKDFSCDVNLQIKSDQDGFMDVSCLPDLPFD